MFINTIIKNFVYFQIKITVIDINNKFPQIEDFETVIEMYENATTGDHIVTVIASDKDRDGIFFYFSNGKAKN
jgi:hypothetical protein